MASRHVLSFKYAFGGIWTAFKEEPHLKFHFLFAIFVMAASFVLNLSLFEQIIVVLVIGLVIGLELTNTAIETIVDSFTSESHPSAKKAKDVSAGAVLIICLIAAIIGVVIFLPHLLTFLAKMG